MTQFNTLCNDFKNNKLATEERHRTNVFQRSKSYIQKHTPHSLVITESSPLPSGRRQASSLLPLLLNVVVEIVARTIRQEKGKKATQIGKGKTKLSLLMEDT